MKVLINLRKLQKKTKKFTNLFKISISRKFKERPPQFRNQKVFARVILSSAVFIIVYFTSSKEKTTTLAGIKEVLSLREHKVECSSDSFDPDLHPSCLQSHCGRFASDNVISETELLKLKALSVNVINTIFKDDEESSLAVELNSESLAKHEVLSKSIDEVLKVGNFFQIKFILNVFLSTTKNIFFRHFNQS